MKTASVSQASEVLRTGGVVLVPTETVVGLVASGRGLRRLSEIKDRDPEKPIALLCATTEEAFEMASNVPVLARKLAERYWPGPLTLILSATGGGTIGVRVPDHAVVGELLSVYGGPLYATSANPAGESPPAALEDVEARIKDIVDAVVEGHVGKGEASAVVDLSSDEVRLLRSNSRLTEKTLVRLVEDTEESV